MKIPRPKFLTSARSASRSVSSNIKNINNNINNNNSTTTNGKILSSTLVHQSRGSSKLISNEQVSHPIATKENYTTSLSMKESAKENYTTPLSRKDSAEENTTTSLSHHNNTTTPLSHHNNNTTSPSIKCDTQRCFYPEEPPTDYFDDGMDMNVLNINNNIANNKMNDSNFLIVKEKCVDKEFIGKKK